MTDLEMTVLCAESMVIFSLTLGIGGEKWFLPDRPYDPLHDDAQVMALVKKFPMVIEHPFLGGGDHWHVEAIEVINGIYIDVSNKDLSRAIVECVAKMQLAKTSVKA